MRNRYHHAILIGITSSFLLHACSFAHNAEEFFKQCLVHYEKRELEKAASCFEKARRGDFRIRATLMLARTHYFENKFSDARALLEDIVEDEPSHTSALYWLARTLAVDPHPEGSDEREKMAIEYLKKALEVDTHHMHARLLLALLFEKRGMHREALYEYLAALEEEEILVTARANLGILYKRLGLSERARNEINCAIAISKAASIPTKNLTTIKDEISEK